MTDSTYTKRIPALNISEYSHYTACLKYVICEEGLRIRMIPLNLIIQTARVAGAAYLHHNIILFNWA